jgi:hypothetical protein
MQLRSKSEMSNMIAILDEENVEMSKTCGTQKNGNTMSQPTILAKWMLLAEICAGSILFSEAAAQAPPPATKADQPAASVSASRSRPNRFPKRERNYYQLVWGVDSFAVRWVESGAMIRFNYRIVNADKAKILNDKNVDPLLIDPRAGVQLTVPSMERGGPLRQTDAPEVGKFYWMAFSNKGKYVKRGDRVSVAIGSFKVDDLVVQ